MAHRRAPAEDAEVGLIEDLAHEAHPPHDAEVTPVAGRDACRFLPAVLERVETEVREARNVALL